MAYTGWVVAGSQLQLKIGTVYTNINGVSSFDISGASKPDIDLTAISDTAKVYKVGMPDWGTADFSLFWDPLDTTHVQLKTQFDNTSSPTDEWKVLLKDQYNAKIWFNGSVRAHDVSLSGPDAGASVKCSVKLSGTVVINNT